MVVTNQAGKFGSGAGIFRAGSDKQALWVGDDWHGFEAKWKELDGKGLRLTDLKVYGPAVS